MPPTKTPMDRRPRHLALLPRTLEDLFIFLVCYLSFYFVLCIFFFFSIFPNLDRAYLMLGQGLRRPFSAGYSFATVFLEISNSASGDPF